MLRVGLTGGLASGKSFVGDALRTLGCYLIRADELGHQALAPEGGAYAAVLAEFGSGILKPDGSIDRRKLASIVFSDPARLARLNAIVHPQVFRLQEEQIAEIAAADPSAIVVVEAAIMVETGSHERYQKLILAVCPEEMQIERAMHRDGISREEAAARIRRQLPLAAKVPHADYVIDTSGTKESTLDQVRRVFQDLRSMAQ